MKHILFVALLLVSLTVVTSAQQRHNEKQKTTYGLIQVVANVKSGSALVIVNGIHPKYVEIKRMRIVIDTYAEYSKFIPDVDVTEDCFCDYSATIIFPSQQEFNKRFLILDGPRSDQ